MSTEKKSMMDKILEKVDVIAGPMTKFGQIPFVRGIVNGMVAALPVTMVGSLFLVVYLFCSDGGLTTKALIPFLKPWAGDLALVNSLSMGIMAIYIIIAFGAEYAEIKGINKTTGAVGAFFAFMLLNYNSVGQLVVTAKDGTLSAGASAFESTYWGGAGLITAMIAGAIFGGSAWVATGAYFIGIAAIIISGIMLKKTKMFAGDPAPFVMELPAYHIPTVGNVLRSMWERGWSFIKKAGTIITLSTIFVWFTSYFGWVDGSFGMLTEDQVEYSILAHIGKAICWIFAPLGWGNWQATVAAVTGLVAKENIVGTMGILYGGGDGSVYSAIGAAFTGITGMSFLIFNLLCAPCFAAMGAIKREMNSRKWFWFAIGYECGFAYVIALIVNQLGNLFTGNVNVIGLIFAIALIALIIYMLVRPYKESTKLEKDVKVGANA